MAVLDRFQRDRALERAEGVRSARRELRTRMRTLGRESASLVADLIVADSSTVANMFTWQLVCSVPQVRDEKAQSILQTAGVDPWRKVRALNAEQRTALAVLLRAYAAGEPVRRPEPPCDQPYLERMLLKALRHAPLTAKSVARRIDAPEDETLAACVRLVGSGELSQLANGRFVG